MFKLVLEKADKPETKLPTSTGSWKKQETFFFPTNIRLVKAMDFPVVCMDVRVGRHLSTEELMLLNYGVGEDS